MCSHTKLFDQEARGYFTGVTLPGGTHASFNVNSLGLITQVTDAGNNTWQREHDSAGRITSFTDPIGNQVSYQYDPLNRINRVELPGTGSVTLAYDAAGNIAQEQYPGMTLNYSYDALGRLTNANGVELAYNARGEVTATNGLSVSRDNAGNISSVIHEGGQTVNYGYNGRYLVTTVRDWVGGVTTFNYDAAGRLISMERPNAITRTYTYDAESRVASFTEQGASTLAVVSLERDATGKIIRAVRSVPLAPVFSVGETSSTHDAAGQIVGFDYDPLGRLLDDGIRNYSWDPASRLMNYSEGGHVVSFTNDVFDNILTRTEDGVVRSYIWNYAFPMGALSVVREADKDLRFFVYAPGGALLYSIEAADSSRTFYHFDERGNTLFLTGDSGEVIATYAYTPFGRLTGSTGEVDNPFTFAGRSGVMQEGDTGLYRMRRRIYDSRERQFISRDPVVNHINPLLINPYHYAAQNPIRFIDPTGETPPDTDAPESSIFQDTASAVSTISNATTAIVSGLDVVPSLPNVSSVADILAGSSSANAGGLVGGAANAARSAANGAVNATDQASRIRGFQNAINSASDAAELSRGAKVVGAVGNAATVLGVGMQLNETSNNLDNIVSENDRQGEKAIGSQENCLNNINASYKAKRITFKQLSQKMKACNDAARESLEANTGGAILDIFIEGVDGLIGALGAMLPFPDSWLPWN